MAKYKDWISEAGLNQIKRWAQNGLTNAQIASNIGISKKTFYKWLERFDEFNRVLKKGREHAVELLENALFQKAIGFTKEGRYYPPDTGSAIFLLKNWAKDYYRDKPLNSIELENLKLENKRLKLQNKLLEAGFNEETELDRIDRLLEMIEAEASG